MIGQRLGFSWAVAAAVAATLGVACGGSDGGSTTAPGTVPTTAPSATLDAGEPDAPPVKDHPGSADGGTPHDGDGGGPIVAGGVRFLGRVDVSDPAAPRFAWSATGLVASVEGATIAVKLKSEGSDAFFQPVIDGKPGARFSVADGATQTITLGQGLTSGVHTVELYRESEGMYGDTVFLGFAQGTVKGAPPASGRFIEVIGDSISAGYGNLGNEVHPPWDNTCTFSLDTESAYAAYGSILGRTLGAEVSIVARSGWGVYRDLGGDTSGVVPSIYDHTLGEDASSPKWDFSRKPQAVVVNLGTNDSGKGDPGTPYEDAYVAFVKTIRGHYPDASIFLTIGPMTGDPMLATMRTHLANVALALADPKVKTIDMDTQDTSTTGCDYHPNVAEDEKMAAALAPVIKAQLGW